MQKKKLTMGIMAAFVASTILTGCEPTQSVHNVTSIDSCIAATGDYLQCQNQWDEAATLHEEVAPRFTSGDACMDSFGDGCQQTTIINADGSSSSVFLPMMAGMMIGNMMSNNGVQHHTRTQPLYQEKERRSGGGFVPVNTLATSTGTAVSKGTTNVSVKTASTASKLSSPVTARGGFGMSARGGSSAS